MDERRGRAEPITLLLCALGGEGGGVLSEWLVAAAREAGYAVQSTSVPGVAQRTGATTYYVEVFPVPVAELGGRQPVFSLYPVPGALDALVSSELLETVRQIGNGMASRARTLIITSSARVLTTNERMQMADGRVPPAPLADIVREHSLMHHVFDMDGITRESGTIVSAVMFGAIAASGVLPVPRGACEAVIRAGGKGAEASLRGFARAWDQVSAERERVAFVGNVLGGAATPALSAAATAYDGAMPAAASLSFASPATTSPAAAFAAATLPGPAATAGTALPAAIAARFPSAVHDMLALGCVRLVEYQDAAYRDLYLERLERVLAAERTGAAAGGDARDWATTRTAARYLALWMAYDDIVRVAELKARASRAGRVRREVRVADGELLRVYDYFKPGIPEIAALLPPRWAGALMRWDRGRQSRGQPSFALPLKIGTHGVAGMLALRALAGLKGLRRHGSRYAQEQQAIERWLAAVETGARLDWTLGNEIAECGRLIKGYGSTNERGKNNLLHVIAHLAGSANGAAGTSSASDVTRAAGAVSMPSPPTAADYAARAQAIRSARIAALADEGGIALDRSLVAHGAPPRPVSEVPIRFMRKPDSGAVAAKS
ncbi:MAG: indolepyruvate oxidoreductase subunit beta family protein [Burkholderiales bacterium]|nr:indolepyruvate oxidoreductase subunit beta family protein [Burkholderiales bacterium]